MSWRPTTLDALWRRSVDQHGPRPFLRFARPDGGVDEWTYAEFDGVVHGAAAAFQVAGAEAGSAIHLALTNTPSFVAAWLGASTLGAWIVPSDPFSTVPELSEHLGRTTPVVGLCATSREATYRAADHVPRAVIVVDELDDDLAWAVTETEGRYVPVEACTVPPSGSVHKIPPVVGLTDRAAVMFTSGTTGRPKGVEITQANYAFAGETMATACDLRSDDRQLVVLPLFHANAQYYSFASAIAVGASVALMPAFSASRFVQQAADHGATCASLFAGPIRMILARGGPADPDGPALQLRHCWYAQNLTEQQYATLSDWLGCRPRQLYGMTETIPAVLTDSADDPQPDAMGYVSPGCAVELHDGEIVVGGEPGITLFAGYLDDPTTTAASFRASNNDAGDNDGGDDGRRWFLTSDRARQDPDGRFRFDGRRSDILKVSGENVSLVEVEQVVAAHPSVADVAVVGEPDPVRDEVPVAFVVIAADARGDATLTESLERWCAERLGKAKRPRRFQFVEELPRTSVGKIKKYQLTAAPGSGPAVSASLTTPNLPTDRNLQTDQNLQTEGNAS